jgi:cytochrome c
MHVLAYANERTYIGGTMHDITNHGGYPHHLHPISWCRYQRQFAAGGITWFTGLGNTQEIYSDFNFRSHILGGVLCAARAVRCDCTATLAEAWQKVLLVSDLIEPMVMDIAKDGKIWCAVLSAVLCFLLCFA